MVGLGESGADIVREISEVQNAALMVEGVEKVERICIYIYIFELCLNVVKMFICHICRSFCRFIRLST